jgi:ubiquinone/menaquinone biosynthesis C-methylase UbiE
MMVDETITAAATELGVRTNVDAVLEALGPIDGLEVIDVGCGEGENPRRLADAGARVHGFDPFIDGTDWSAHGTGSFQLVQASADALPVDDLSADIVLFIFSLHHVPQSKLAAALAEARRVLKPSGRLLIAEPLASGPSHYVSAPFHDETAVRAAAAAAVDAYVAPHFRARRILSYTERRYWDSFESYAKRKISYRRFNGYTEEAVFAPEVRRRFDEIFATSNGVFDQPVRIDLFSEPT